MSEQQLRFDLMRDELRAAERRRLQEVRMAALNAAARVLTGHAGGHRLPTDELVTTYAEHFERWLLRPAELDAAEARYAGPVDLAYDPKTQQPCGAFLQPDWYAGDEWNVCSGEHVTGAGGDVGWHRTGADEAGLHVVSFATHHAVYQPGTFPRCACGLQWPCATAEARATDPLRPQSAAPSAPGCNFVWRELMGGDHTHVCRNPTPDAPHICQTCGVAAHVDTIRP